MPPSLFLSLLLCPKRASQSLLLSALGKLVLARSTLGGEKVGDGFRGRGGGGSRTCDIYFPSQLGVGLRRPLTRLSKPALITYTGLQNPIWALLGFECQRFSCSLNELSISLISLLIYKTILKVLTLCEAPAD